MKQISAYIEHRPISLKSEIKDDGLIRSRHVEGEWKTIRNIHVFRIFPLILLFNHLTFMFNKYIYYIN